MKKPTAEEKIENTQDFIKVMSQLMHALEDRELDAEEGALLCKTAAQLINRCRPLFTKWWQRALLDSARSALEECSNHLDKL
jgi:predicted RNA binding protein with dsRBD fold (UPF0201 family)